MKTIHSIKEKILLYGPLTLLMVVSIYFAVKFVNPAPPKTMVIATGDGEGDYQTYARQYHDYMDDDGIELEIRPTRGAMENVNLLMDPKSGVDIAFVQDGLVTAEKAPDLVSLGSMYYEPMWIFYSNKIELPHHTDLTRLSQLRGKKISVGEEGSGTSVLSQRLLKASGVEASTATLLHTSWKDAEDRLRKGTLDVAFLVAPPEDPIVEALLEDEDIHAMSLDQAEGITRQLPFLHHLTLPHGAISLQKNLPPKDIDLVAPTATLVARDSLHPALIFLLLKAATQVHSDPGIFEKKNEFPSDKDYELYPSTDAKHFYKNGIPFWQRYLPFWLASLLERLLIVAVPFFAIILPALKSVPRFLNWRIKRKILARYAELKFLEMKMKSEKTHEKYPDHLRELAKIEERIVGMTVPIQFAEHIYGLRGNVNFVRERLKSDLSI